MCCNGRALLRGRGGSGRTRSGKSRKKGQGDMWVGE